MISRLPKLFWYGLGLFAAGVGPLLLVVAFSADPNPNPVGPGILAMLTFWPSVIMMGIGLVRAVAGRLRN